MNTLQELLVIRANISDVVADLMQDQSPASVDQAIAIYKQLAGISKDVESLQAEVKDALDIALTELGAEYIEGQAGKVMRTAGGERVTWDSKTLDALCLKNPILLEMIGSARKTTKTAGGLRIT